MMTGSNRKVMLQSTWMVWERIFDFGMSFWRESVYKYGICKLVIRKHSGKSINCHDGHRIHAGDWIGELHLDNQQVIELTRSLGADRAGVRTARMLRDAMKQIRYDLEDNPKLADVKALTGITLLHRGIIHGLGFELHPIESNWSRRFLKIYLRLLLRVLHPQGKQRVKSADKKLNPMFLIISREALIERWTHNKFRMNEILE